MKRPLTLEENRMLALIREVGASEAIRRWESDDEGEGTVLAFHVLEHVTNAGEDDAPDWWLVGGASVHDQGKDPS